MRDRAELYLEETVVPLLASVSPRVAAETCLVLEGSRAAGGADEYSDLEAVIYLEDELWAREGGRLQLQLMHAVKPLCPGSPVSSASPRRPEDWHLFGHPEVSVHPRGWLLDHRAEEVLARAQEVPWEAISIESLHKLHYESKAVRDPEGLLARLREATVPERVPDWLWRKHLILTLAQLKGAPHDLSRAVARRALVEANLLLGEILGHLLKLGFLICRRYYPYAKRMRSAFAQLPLPADVPRLIDSVAATVEWTERAGAVLMLCTRYAELIVDRRLLLPEVLEHLFPARNQEAWLNPAWLPDLRERERQAREAGYGPDDEWVWSLWGEVLGGP